jgi:hypothetical protein
MNPRRKKRLTIILAIGIGFIQLFGRCFFLPVKSLLSGLVKQVQAAHAYQHHFQQGVADEHA